MAKNRQNKQKNRGKKQAKSAKKATQQVQETVEAKVESTTASAPTNKKAEPAINRRAEIRASKLAAEYGYVGKELRTIGILAAGLFVLLVLLNVIL